MSILKHFASNKDVGMKDAILPHLTYHLQTLLTDLLKVEIVIKQHLSFLYSVTLHLHNHKVGLLRWVNSLYFSTMIG